MAPAGRMIGHPRRQVRPLAAARPGARRASRGRRGDVQRGALPAPLCGPAGTPAAARRARAGRRLTIRSQVVQERSRAWTDCLSAPSTGRPSCVSGCWCARGRPSSRRSARWPGSRRSRRHRRTSRSGRASTASPSATSSPRSTTGRSSRRPSCARRCTSSRRPTMPPSPSHPGSPVRRTGRPRSVAPASMPPPSMSTCWLSPANHEPSPSSRHTWMRRPPTT